MSWLLVVLIPALLMLATFGLERLESALDKDTVSAADVAEFLEQAKAGDVGTLARAGMAEALDGIHRRHSDGQSPSAAVPNAAAAQHLPIRLYPHGLGNPEFQPTRHANRV